MCDRDTKVCYKCERILSVTEFHYNKNSKDGLQHRCKKCRANLERAAGRQRIRNKRYSFCKNYDKVMERYDTTTNCECCGKKFSNIKYNMVNTKCIDHQDDIIRGIICGACNLGIGHLGDNIIGVTNAVEYLRRENGY
jgi:hypothetical protein